MRPFAKHFEELRQDSKKGEIMCINLVRGVKNDNEVMLKQRFEEMVALAKLPYLTYQFFDYHNECHDNPENLIKLIDNQVNP